MKDPRHDEILSAQLFRASLFLLVTYSLLSGVRLAVAPMHSLGAHFILVTCGVFLITALFSYFKIRARQTGYFMVTGILVIVVARAFVAGGIASPVLIIMIIVPVTALFLLGRVAGVIYTVAVIIFMLIFIWLGITGYEFPSLVMDSRAQGTVNGAIIIFVMAVCSWIAWLYTRNNDVLTSKLQEQAHKDHLTGVPNRRAFDFALEKEIKLARRQQQPLTLFMVDLDYFKSFNDLYGHYEGDQCLIKVSNIIQSCLRRPGDMVARYGGEEFSVILPDTSMRQAHQLAETMRHAVLGLNIKHQDSPQKVVTITLGISGMDLDKDVQPETLIMQADEALYAGKEAGRNQVFVTESDQAQLALDSV